jgi:hypothetical protein
MPSQHHLVGRIAGGLLLIVITAACHLLGPDLHVSIDNTGGPRDVTVTVDSSGPGVTDGDDVVVPDGEGSAWSVPLGSTWEVKIDGTHVIGSGDRTDLAQPPPVHVHDVSVCIRVAPDGTFKLYDGCWVDRDQAANPSG